MIGIARAALRVPLFYKIVIANAVIVVLGTIAGTAITRWVLEHPAGRVSTVGVVALLAGGGAVVTVLVNGLIVRLALQPLKLLERAAAGVRAGEVDARVPESALADREMARLTSTFNSMLEGLEGYRDRLREVAARALEAEEQERKRIARELHDDTAQTLAALLIRLRVLRVAQDPEASQAVLEQLRSDLVEAIERIRRFARGLRPPALDDLGLVPALESHVRGLGESTGVAIRLDAEPIDEMLGPQAELALYRIAQEALSNAVRHSGAERIDLVLRRRPRAVELVVSDGGRGFDVEAVQNGEGGGLGLFGMRERAVYLGGEVEIDSRIGNGTRVRATVPAERAHAPR